MSEITGFLNICAAYITIQLIHCVLFSVLLSGFVLLLRQFQLPANDFTKGILWTLFLLLPFLGRLKLFYEIPAAERMTGRMMQAMKEHSWSVNMYIAGILAAVFWTARKRLHLRRMIAGMEKKTFGHIQVRVTDMCITPFSAGLVRPEIILPKAMAENYSEEELYFILQHEKTHIRLGHLWCFFAWDLLCCLLWVNPLLRVCQKYFRTDMEDICDRVCIQNSGKKPHEYGMVLLKSLKLLQNDSKDMPPAAAYAGEKDFADIKRRMEKIAAFRPYPKRQWKKIAAAVAAVLCTAFVFIQQNSYARCSEDETILIYEYDGEKAVFTDFSDRLRQMISYDESAVYVDREAFDRYLYEKNTKGDIFIVFGGFYKLPGFGSGACSCYYERGRTEQIVQLPYEKPVENWMLALFKIL